MKIKIRLLFCIGNECDISLFAHSESCVRYRPLLKPRRPSQHYTACDQYTFLVFSITGKVQNFFNKNMEKTEKYCPEDECSGLHFQTFCVYSN